MANTSIFAAFEEMWQRVIFALNGKSDVSHKHDDTYETKTDASNKLGEAKDYTDTHNVATDAHNDIRLLISELVTKLNNFLDVDDTTTDQLSEVITLINNNKGTLESLTTSKVNVADIIDNLTTNVSNKPLSAAQAVVLKGLIDDLETELSNHTHDTYETKTDASTKLAEAKSYTDTKIAAIPTPDVSGQINEHNTSETAHEDIRDSITDLEEVVVYMDKEDNEDVPDEKTVVVINPMTATEEGYAADALRTKEIFTQIINGFDLVENSFDSITTHAFLDRAVEFDGSTNWNNCIKNGSYKITSLDGTNAPPAGNSYGVLNVFSPMDGQYFCVVQMYTTTTSYSEFYIRVGYDGNFYDWRNMSAENAATSVDSEKISMLLTEDGSSPYVRFYMNGVNMGHVRLTK